MGTVSDLSDVSAQQGSSQGRFPDIGVRDQAQINTHQLHVCHKTIPTALALPQALIRHKFDHRAASLSDRK